METILFFNILSQKKNDPARSVVTLCKYRLSAVLLHHELEARV
jgi:hypothetical protein